MQGDTFKSIGKYHRIRSGRFSEISVRCRGWGRMEQLRHVRSTLSIGHHAEDQQPLVKKKSILGLAKGGLFAIKAKQAVTLSQTWRLFLLQNLETNRRLTMVLMCLKIIIDSARWEYYRKPRFYTKTLTETLFPTRSCVIEASIRTCTRLRCYQLTVIHTP